MVKRMPHLELKDIKRSFAHGTEEVFALRNIDLEIERGEFIALIGTSGSGKSTLLNVIGCLDKSTSGQYAIDGVDVGSIDPGAMADIRLSTFGFVFQRYHLLSGLTAIENVELPARYMGISLGAARDNAISLLSALGIEQFKDAVVDTLSGGQQQRVAIARALVNGADIILADEPTAALDKENGKQIVEIFGELNRQGRTVIVATHDETIAEAANRVVRLEDGRVVSDETRFRSSLITPLPHLPADKRRRSLTSLLRMSYKALRIRSFQTFLTALGMSIGVASVILVVAFGKASSLKTLENIRSLANDTLDIYPGKHLGDPIAPSLSMNDVAAISAVNGVGAVSPVAISSTSVRWRSTEANATLYGVGSDYFAIKALRPTDGRTFTSEDVDARAQNVVIDTAASRTLFGEGATSAVGSVLSIDGHPARVIGIVQSRVLSSVPSQTLTIYAPITSVQTRWMGTNGLRNVSVLVEVGASDQSVERAIQQKLSQVRSGKSFFVMNSAAMRRTLEEASETLTLLVATVAAISLFVGGIGIMNVMLISVRERAPEIALRMAVGARPSDILRQFITEATLLCVAGGVAGVGVAVGLAQLGPIVLPSVPFAIGATSTFLSLFYAAIVGLVFGYLPARNAARCDPAKILSSAI